ncbi:Restriction endonuclease [Mitsuaria sp. PDC51]|uniref:restriction endonuclease n=1 Tax=Mitsuaria sp. PDC51 TaxID=1881035 RepID=UPI0008EE9EDD|nr:restriction endonuclease [Mitsuaria sp. PDC51]SFR74909.1 Restriction endonuclease [Mitsuaria sp. PDC51]
MASIDSVLSPLGEDLPLLHLSEMEHLREAMLTRRERVVAISGDNATGKTLLWRTMLERHREDLVGGVEAISCRHTPRSLPRIAGDTALIVLDDLDNESIESWFGPIATLLHQHPEKQVLLVGCYPEFFERFGPSTHIRMATLDDLHVRRTLSKLLSGGSTATELRRAVDYCRGDIRLLRALVRELSANPGDLHGALQTISSGVEYALSSGGLLLPDRKREWLEFTSHIQTVNGQLLRSVQKNPNAIFDLTSRQFEEVTGELLEKLGYKVELTKATRDGGKDLILASHSNVGQFVYYVECKRYAPERPVGVHLVRELVGAIYADRVTAGIMVTSSYFSPDAVSYSQQLKHQLTLVDFLRLKAWLKDAH